MILSACCCSPQVAQQVRELTDEKERLQRAAEEVGHEEGERVAALAAEKEDLQGKVRVEGESCGHVSQAH